MKQHIIIGFSIILLLLAVYLISSDLFRSNPVQTEACCNDEIGDIKLFDTTLLGYYRSKVWETGHKGLTGLSVSDNNVVICGGRMVAIFDMNGLKTGGFSTDSVTTCISVINNEVLVGTVSGAARFDFSGNICARYDVPYAGSYVTSIATDAENVYIADAGKRRVLKFTYDGSFVKEFGRKDSAGGLTGFVIPSPYFDISCGGFNDLWIVNPGKLRVENYSSTGIIRSSWGEDLSMDTRFTGCCNPSHFSILPDGSFVTYEKGNDKIKVFGREGQFRSMVAGAGSFKGKSDFMLGRNNLVKDMATDASGAIYILDAYNRINIYRPKND